MRFRLFHLPLALLVLVQPSILCACAVEHAFFCGDGPESHPGDASVLAQVTPSRDAACGTPCAACRGHHSRAACASRESLRVGHKPQAELGMPALPAFGSLGRLDPFAAVAHSGFRATAPESPPGSDRQLPLLN